MLSILHVSWTINIFLETILFATIAVRTITAIPFSHHKFLYDLVLLHIPDLTIHAMTGYTLDDTAGARP